MHLRDLVQFLSELEENNNRAWFVMNKPRYDILRGELLTLVETLIAGITRFDPVIAHCNPKKAMFEESRLGPSDLIERAYCLVPQTKSTAIQIMNQYIDPR